MVLPEDKLEDLRRQLSESHKDKIAFYDETRRGLARRRQAISRQKAFDLLTEGSITPDAYNENLKRYESDIKAILEEEERLEDANENYYVTIGYLLDVFENAGTLFDKGTVDKKRQIVNLVLSNLVLTGKKLDFTLKEPFATLLSCKKGTLWLGMRDSNPRMVGPEPTALPLGESPTSGSVVIRCKHNYTTSLFTSQCFDRILLRGSSGRYNSTN